MELTHSPAERLMLFKKNMFSGTKPTSTMPKMQSPWNKQHFTDFRTQLLTWLKSMFPQMAHMSGFPGHPSAPPRNNFSPTFMQHMSKAFPQQ